MAYVISWGFRKIIKTTKPARAELSNLAEQAANLRYLAVRAQHEDPEYKIFERSTYINDLRILQGEVDQVKIDVAELKRASGK